MHSVQGGSRYGWPGNGRLLLPNSLTPIFPIGQTLLTPDKGGESHDHGQRSPLLWPATMTVKVEQFAQNLTPEQEVKVTQLEEAVASVVQASFLSALECGRMVRVMAHCPPISPNEGYLLPTLKHLFSAFRNRHCYTVHLLCFPDIRCS
jgi:hypothetical protein